MSQQACISLIDSNTKIRASKASETTVFLEKQLEELKVSLEDYEKQLQAFKSTHMGQLPEQVQTNTATLLNLQSNLDTIQRSLTDARNRKINLEGIDLLDTSKPVQHLLRGTRIIAELKVKLKISKELYTEHPEFKNLRSDQGTESKKEALIEFQTPERGGGGATELRIQLRATNNEIAVLRGCRPVNAKINQYQEGLKTHENEQELQ
jgi:deoxyribodipyrimidine photolyase